MRQLKLLLIQFNSDGIYFFNAETHWIIAPKSNWKFHWIKPINDYVNETPLCKNVSKRTVYCGGKIFSHYFSFLTFARKIVNLYAFFSFFLSLRRLEAQARDRFLIVHLLPTQNAWVKHDNNIYNRLSHFVHRRFDLPCSSFCGWFLSCANHFHQNTAK